MPALLFCRGNHFVFQEFLLVFGIDEGNGPAERFFLAIAEHFLGGFVPHGYVPFEVDYDDGIAGLFDGLRMQAQCIFGIFALGGVPGNAEESAAFGS